MKKIFLILPLLLLLSAFAQAAPSFVQSTQLSDQLIVDNGLLNPQIPFKHLVSSGVTVAGHYGTFRESGATTGYTPPAGKKCVIVAFETYNTSAGSTSIVVGYGDTDIGLDAAAAPTNPIALWGGFGAAPSGSSRSSYQGYLAAGKYLYINESTNANQAVTCICMEIAI